MTGMHTIRFVAKGAPRGTLVALPGLMESAETLETTLRHWAKAGFDVLGIDPRGHGKSPRWTADLLAQSPGDVIVADVLATLEETPIDQALPLVVFGHSAGGSVAAALAVALAPRVGAVILEDPFWRLPVTSLQDPAVAACAVTELRRFRNLDETERLAETRARYPLWPEDELPAWSRSKDEMDESLVANGTVIPTRSWPTLLSDLAVTGTPALVITGTIRAGMTPNHRAILGRFGVEVAVVRGATHFIRRDARDLFHELTEAFLDRHLPANGSDGAVLRTPIENKSGLHVTPRNLQDLGGPTWPK